MKQNINDDHHDFFLMNLNIFIMSEIRFKIVYIREKHVRYNSIWGSLSFSNIWNLDVVTATKSINSNAVGSHHTPPNNIFNNSKAIL